MPNLKIITLLFFLASFASSFAMAELGWNRYPPGVSGLDGKIVRYSAEDTQSCGRARLIGQFGVQAEQSYWNTCRNQLAETGTLKAFDLRYYGLAGTLLASLLGLLLFMIAVNRHGLKPKVVRGREYLNGGAAMRALKQHSRRECRQSGTGLHFPPTIPMSADRESRHFLIWGSTGAGKTQAMLHLITQAIDRGDKVIVLDVKGDMTAKLPYIGGLIAPHDKRSLQWDIARDCVTKQEARELAARLIPDSRDPIWSDAAREILITCIVALQTRKDWGWADLRKTAVSDTSELLELAKQYHPEAITYLEDTESKTNQSILATFKAHMSDVSMLADAWPDPAGKRAFSICQWLESKAHAPIIIQYDGRHPALTKSWISGMIGLLASHAGSPSTAENPERRTWVFLDEFPQLARLDHFSTLIDVGRSKGISVVLGAQDIAQIRKTYGHDQADAWIGMIGTHVITRMNLGQSAEVASRLIGMQTVEIVRKSESYSAGRITTTRVKAQETRPVVTPSELSSRLGPTRRGIKALLIGPGEHAYEVLLPYVQLREERPASVRIVREGSPPCASVKSSEPYAQTSHALSLEAATRIRKLGQ